MTKLPDWFGKVVAVWGSIGSLLVLLGISTPEWLPALFTQGFIQAVSVFFGALISFYQVLRAIFAKEQALGVSTMSGTEKLAYILNPFKLM